MDTTVQSMSQTSKQPVPPHFFDPFSAFLSYLVPGLGQIYQGRITKGLLFFFGIYILFFYGMWMGQWKNVWIPYVQNLPEVIVFGYKLDGFPKSLSYRPQFIAQFWIGIAAWPAIIQYIVYDPHKDHNPYIGKYQRAPSEHELNLIQRKSTKRWDLGWVLTVIAGVLNLLVIYDALSGPMVRDATDPAQRSYADSEVSSGDNKNNHKI